jgi:hypothetical protein
LKYYYVFYYAQLAMSGWQPIGEATDKHPFEYMKKDVAEWAHSSIINEVRLVSWQEITEEEYLIWKKINDIE